MADLLAASDSELAAMDGLGRKSLSEIREFIRKMGNIVIG
ncbi:DNA-directed RNA polymerase subunit alpha C-terminal domain-containing protein [Sphingobacterium multivorum]